MNLHQSSRNNCSEPALTITNLVENEKTLYINEEVSLNNQVNMFGELESAKSNIMKDL